MAVTILDDYPPNSARGNSCYSCGAGRRDIRNLDTGELRSERIVDLDLTIDYEGRACFCEQCIIEAGLALGLVDNGLSVRLDEQLTAVTLELEETRAQRDRAQHIAAELRSYDSFNGVWPQDVQPPPSAAHEVTVFGFTDGPLPEGANPIGEHRPLNEAPVRLTKSRSKETSR